MRALKQHPKVTTENPELADRFDRVLGQTVQAMEEAGIRYAFIGGIASSGLGRPRSTHDIDLFVRPEDAELSVRALAKHGFKVERTDPSWLYKGFKEDVLVDVIFRSKGEIYLDTEMYQRMRTAEFHGRQLRLVGPEDLLIIKAVAHSELTPNHWHDAIALLMHASMDWRYLVRRARRAPRRILSLLLYAQSNDIWVPNYVIQELYEGVFGGGVESSRGEFLGQGSLESRVAPIRMTPKTAESVSHEYQLAHLREQIAENLKTNELDIQIEQAGDRILLRGEVSVPERKAAIEQLAREAFPGFQIENQIRILFCTETGGSEAIK